MNKIKIIIPFYNPGDFLELCASSVMNQNYDNYEVLFINDCSTDDSVQKHVPRQLPKLDENNKIVLNENGQVIFENSHPILNKTKCKNVLYWKSGTRVTALPNIHNGIIQFANNSDDIVVLLDGDDWLINKNVLSYINEFYEKNTECWMMYGSAQWTDGRNCCSQPYTENDYKKGLRKSSFKISHIRTFRSGLYTSIGKQDPKFKCMQDDKGEWYKSCYDVAMFVPMLEMAGIEHVFHNAKKLYVYNRDNPINDDKVNQKLQWDIHNEINTKKPFNKIQHYNKL